MRFSNFLVAIVATIPTMTQSHMEDLCIDQQRGIYNFFSIAKSKGCDYRDVSLPCIQAVIQDAQQAFGDTSVCRGVVHFNAVYFIAAALGFQQDHAYFLAAFSQAIDFVQFKAVDSCGNDMDKRFWTPPMRGLLRTVPEFGGTIRHLGTPFIGWSANTPFSIANVGRPLTQSKKMYTGGSIQGCDAQRFTKTYDDYVTPTNTARCAGLRPDFNDDFYEGALSSAKRWAFGQSNVLCNAGFTIPDPMTGSVFTGSSCPLTGTTTPIDIGPIQQGPIPIRGANMQLGEQVIHFECTDNDCQKNPASVNPQSKILASQFSSYLKQQPFAKLHNGDAVPELIARMGIFLHWVHDRASHFYCVDAPGSGLLAVPRTSHSSSSSKSDYDLTMYLDMAACNVVQHGMTHYWEQGLLSALAPASYSALAQTYLLLAEFRNKHQDKDWFRKDFKPLSFDVVVGTDVKPGVVYNITQVPEADKRFEEEVNALRRYGLPPMPGFEKMCAARSPTMLRGSNVNAVTA